MGYETTISGYGVLYTNGVPFVKIKEVKEIKSPKLKNLTDSVVGIIDRVFWNEKKRVFGIKFIDGNVCTVHCSPNDTWDIEKGLLACLVKYFIGGNTGSYNKLFKLLDEDCDTEKHG